MDPPKASDALRADHRKMETHLDGLLYALKHLHAERVRDIRKNFLEIQQLAHIHLEQEERVFYPAIRSAAPELLAHMDGQHQDIRQTEQCLDELLAAFPASPSDRDLVELRRCGIEFHDALQVHIVDEEDNLLKVADSCLSDRQQELLFAAMQETA